MTLEVTCPSPSAPVPTPGVVPALRVLVALLAVPALLAAQEGKAEGTKGEKKWDVNAPPGEAATVAIDTRTGTWMSVDASPDGRTLVFDLLGDLYALPIEGGEAQPLTHSIAWEMQPRFSPDGKRIAFVSDAGGGDNVWLMDADGSHARALTSEDFRLVNSPVWHPRGDAIAARKHFSGTRSLGSGEIWLFHTGGGKGLPLNEKPNWQKDLGEPAFSPDGRYVYFSQDTTPGRTFQYNKNSRTQIYEIQRLDLEDGRVEAFVSGPGGAVRPVPSPDGKQLAFVRRLHGRSTLFVKDLKTGEERPVWNGLERDLQEAWAIHGVYPAFAWLPGSREIVVWAQGKLWRVSVPGGEAREIAFHVKDTRELRRPVRFANAVAPDSFDVRQLRWTSVSPAGDAVVYSALGHLYVKELPGGEPRRLTRQSDHFEYYPSFARDGRSLVFVTWDDETLGSVRRLDLASGRETVLTAEPGKYLEPAVSPDGRSVVYLKSRGGYLTSPWYGLETGVYRVSADGSGQPRLVSREGEAPQFGAASDRVYVTRTSVTNEVDLATTLVSVPLDAGEEREVVKSERATELRVSPDGRWIAFVEGFQVFVAPFPQTGRPLELGPKAESLPLKRLSAWAGEYLHWSGDSQRVHFTLGDQLFTRELKDAFAWLPGAPETLPEPSEQGTPIGFRQRTDVPSATIALTGARIVTMRGDEVIDNGTLIVRGNRIVAVGPPSAVTPPAGATVVDVAGKTIIPGLVDAHWHGGMGEDEIIPQQSWVDYASLAFGVTTLHDPSNDTSEIFTHAEMQRAGELVAPRIFSTGTILYGAKARFSAKIDSLDEALAHLERLKAEGAISVKSYNQPRRDQRQQVLEAARRTGMLVVPEGGSLFQHNMTMVVDGHTTVEHSLPVPAVYDDVKQLWSATAVGYTPTLGVAYGGLDGEHYFYATTEVWKHPLLRRYVPQALLEARAVRRETAPEEDFNVIRAARAAAELQRAGVQVSIGAHGQREGLAAHWEMWMLVKGGLTPLEAIRCATLTPARVLGLDADIGSLEPGKLADLVVIDGDPLADIRQSDRVSHVMQNGRLYEAATMNEVGATPRPRRPFFFERIPGGYVPLDAEAIGHGGEH
jgi:imidazolonepropionase-like amidohydrolase/Tol biopolymer transport system component